MTRRQSIYRLSLLIQRLEKGKPITPADVELLKMVVCQMDGMINQLETNRRANQLIGETLKVLKRERVIE